jgi:hypothetical protein
VTNSKVKPGSLPIDADATKSVVAAAASATPLAIGVVGTDGDADSGWNPTPTRKSSVTSGLS